MVTSMNVTNVKPVLWPHWLAAMEVIMLSVVIGLGGGWTSPYLAKLTSPDSTLSVSDEEASWIAAIMGIGRIVGAVTGAVTVDYLGSKKATLLTGVPTAIGWILLLVGYSVPLIYLSRILTGFGLGMYFSTFPMYMGEISNPKIRGALVSLTSQGMPIGVLLGNIIGAYTPMWIFACISLVPNVAFLVFFSLMPDSPHYLILQDRIDDARKSLEWYNRDVDSTPELEKLQDFLSQKKSVTYSDKIGQLFSATNLKAVMIVSIVFIFVQLSGLWTLSFYMEIILTNAGVKVIDPALVVIIVGVLGIMFGWVSMYTNDKCGRRTLLSTSAIGIAFAYLLLGVDYQLLDLGISTELVTQWLPIIAILLFQCFLCVGIVPVPSTLLSEMFSPDIKSTASCFANLCSAVFAFITSKTYQPMVALTSEQYVFWFYGLIMLGLAIYGNVCMPETKGKTLPEIQEMLAQKKGESSTNAKSSV